MNYQTSGEQPEELEMFSNCKYPQIPSLQNNK